MIAIKRLQSIMWILVVAMGALCAYLISLRVATERNMVKSVERQIYQTRANIRYLEVEFSARASMRQLESWNAQAIRYSVPRAGQYLASEQQLAALDRIAPSGQPYVAPPVIAAMAEADITAPAAPVKAVVPVQRATQSEFSLIKSAVAAEPVVMRTAVAKTKPVEPKPAKIETATRRSSRLALLDEKLLDTATLRRLDLADADGAKAGR